MSFGTGISCCSASTFKRLGLWAAGVWLAASPVHANIEGREWVFHQSSGDRHFIWSGAHAGLPSVPLDELVKAFSLRAHFDPDDFRVRLESADRSGAVEFHTYATRVEGRIRKAAAVTGFSIDLSNAPRFEGPRLYVPIDFGDRALRPLLTGVAPSNPLVRESRRLDVLIDPGHGGNDFGASVRANDVSLHEKDLVLDFAHELQRQLQARGVRAGLTREDDAFLTLTERTGIANETHAKLFISLHLNSEPTGHGKGVEVYVLSLGKVDAQARRTLERENVTGADFGTDAEVALARIRAEASMESSLAWAKLVASTLGRDPARPNAPTRPKGIKSGPFYVLLGAEMPALLVELGFLSHEGDRAQLLSAPERQRVTRDLAQALAQRLNPQSQLKDRPRQE